MGGNPRRRMRPERADFDLPPVAGSAPGALWAVFLYRLPLPKGSPSKDPAFLGQLRAIPYEGATFLRLFGASGVILCWKEDAMRPRDLEGLVERVATVPAFARSCATLRFLHDRGRSLASGRFGLRFDPHANAFTAYGAEWRLGAAFLSLPWPLPQRPWQFFSRMLLCLEWCAPNTAIVAKWERTRSGARLAWDRRIVRPLEEVGGAAQEYPLLATVRPLSAIKALLVTADLFEQRLRAPDPLPA